MDIKYILESYTRYELNCLATRKTPMSLRQWTFSKEIYLDFTDLVQLVVKIQDDVYSLDAESATNSILKRIREV